MKPIFNHPLVSTGTDPRLGKTINNWGAAVVLCNLAAQGNDKALSAVLKLATRSNPLLSAKTALKLAVEGDNEVAANLLHAVKTGLDIKMNFASEQGQNIINL